MSGKVKFRFSLTGFIVLLVLLVESIIANFINKTYAATLPEKYDLRSEISIVVKNQYQNGICPYMSRSTLLETHIKLGQKNGKYDFFKETPVFSVLTYKSPGQYVPISIDRTEKVLQELYGDTNKTEDDVLKVSGEYSNEKIKQAMEKIQPSLDVTYNGQRDSSNNVQYKRLPTILKEYNDNGIVYKDSKRNVISKAQVDEIRSQYKEFIMENGGLVCGVQTNGFRDGLNGGSVCFNREKSTDAGNHSVIIIGWDDTYSRDNFPEEIRPDTDGAYLVQNSWGSEWGDRGVFYVSYDDIYVEMDIYGIEGVTEYKDVTRPDITIDEEKSGKIKITATDRYSSGLNEKTLKYKWTDRNIEPDVNDSTWTSITNGQEIENKNGKFLWVYGEDNVGNMTLFSTGDYSNELIIQGAEEECSKWENTDVEVLIRDAMTLLNEYEPFETLITSTSFSQSEIKQMEKIQDNYDHILTISKDGKHVLYISKIYNGEELKARKITVWIDKTKPTDPVITVNGSKENDKYCTGAVVTIKGGEDKVSGVKETDIVIKDKDGKDVVVKDKTQFTLSEVGTYTVKVTTTDNAGNSSSKEQTIDIVNKTEDPKQDDSDKKDENPKQDDSDKKDEDPKQDDSDKEDENPKQDDTNKENEQPKQDDSQKEDENLNDKSSEIKNDADSKYNNSQKEQNNPNEANKILPSTGSNNEYSLVIAIAAIIFLGLTIHSYKNLKNER